MAKTKKRTPKKRTAKKQTPQDNLPLRNFDLGKRYDVYWHTRRGLAVAKNVLVKGKRTFEKIEELKGPFIQYLELEDPKGRTFMLQYLHVFMVCEAGTKPRFAPIPQ